MKMFYAIYIPSGEAIAADLSLCSPEDAKLFEFPAECMRFINDNFEIVVDDNGEPLFEAQSLTVTSVA